MYTQFIYSFFSYSYGDHRDLHSFPTRRSSDLSRFLQVHSRCVGNEKGVFNVHVISSLPRSLKASNRRLAPSPSDRKSTRLNSSHVEISYAVFCLKKIKRMF